MFTVWLVGVWGWIVGGKKSGASLLTCIADRDINIAICNTPMRLSDKIRYLREVEGNLRGLNRSLTQQELVRAIQEENGSGRRASISQSYLSQIESGARPHLTNTTRMLLARFFKVHPGYLVDDPEGYHTELLSDLRTIEDKLDLWLISGSERFRRDPALCQALLTLANHADSRRCFLLLEAIIETPALVDRLFHVLRSEASTAPTVSTSPDGQKATNAVLPKAINRVRPKATGPVRQKDTQRSTK
jgi:transcriptional regulator with XRE-family HTH domain